MERRYLHESCKVKTHFIYIMDKEIDIFIIPCRFGNSYIGMLVITRQWAAVRTYFDDISDPPQEYDFFCGADSYSNKATQGNSLIAESSPPNTLFGKVKF